MKRWESTAEKERMGRVKRKKNLKIIWEHDKPSKQRTSGLNSAARSSVMY